MNNFTSMVLREALKIAILLVVLALAELLLVTYSIPSKMLVAANKTIRNVNKIIVYSSCARIIVGTSSVGEPRVVLYQYGLGRCLLDVLERRGTAIIRVRRAEPPFFTRCDLHITLPRGYKLNALELNLAYSSCTISELSVKNLRVGLRYSSARASVLARTFTVEASYSSLSCTLNNPKSITIVASHSSVTLNIRGNVSLVISSLKASTINSHGCGSGAPLKIVAQYSSVQVYCRR